MRWLLKTSIALLLLLGGTSCDQDSASFWSTPDQQGLRLFRAGEYAEAAGRFVDPQWQGAALFRDGQFEAAAGAFGRLDSADASFNRGNSLVMQGKYDEAIGAYDRALEQRSEWQEAQENRELAALRRDRKKPPEDDAGGTGGKLAADEIVFDDAARNKKSPGEEQVEVGAGDKLSDAELRALWLKRVQTKPRDFLRAKFAYQRSRGAGAGGGSE
jgi:Ca-activated chloride channel family protein